MHLQAVVATQAVHTPCEHELAQVSSYLHTTRLEREHQPMHMRTAMTAIKPRTQTATLWNCSAVLPVQSGHNRHSSRTAAHNKHSSTPGTHSTAPQCWSHKKANVPFKCHFCMCKPCLNNACMLEPTRRAVCASTCSLTAGNKDACKASRHAKKPKAMHTTTKATMRLHLYTISGSMRLHACAYMHVPSCMCLHACASASCM